MAYNFDCESNIISRPTAACKAINNRLFDKKGVAGIWIANENLDIVGWRQNSDGEYVNTKEHSVTARGDVEVLGRGLINPRIIVLQRSQLLKRNCKTTRIEGIWNRGDGDKINDDKSKMYQCVRRYMLLFLDENNKPLHSSPIQLTSSGNFMFHFDQKYMKFRADILAAYCKDKKKSGARMSEQWYSMCVFVPKFISKSVGKSPDMMSAACITESYLVPESTNWRDFVVAFDPKTNEIVVDLYNDTLAWLERANNVKKTKPKESEEEFSEDNTQDYD